MEHINITEIPVNHLISVMAGLPNLDNVKIVNLMGKDMHSSIPISKGVGSDVECVLHFKTKEIGKSLQWTLIRVESSITNDDYEYTPTEL